MTHEQAERLLHGIREQMRQNSEEFGDEFSTAPDYYMEEEDRPPLPKIRAKTFLLHPIGSPHRA